MKSRIQNVTVLFKFHSHTVSTWVLLTG